jgi:hypothetical protein
MKPNGWKAQSARQGKPPEPIVWEPSDWELLLDRLSISESEATKAIRGRGDMAKVLRTWVKNHYTRRFIPEAILAEVGLQDVIVWAQKAAWSAMLAGFRNRWQIDGGKSKKWPIIFDSPKPRAPYLFPTKTFAAKSALTDWLTVGWKPGASKSRKWTHENKIQWRMGVSISAGVALALRSLAERTPRETSQRMPGEGSVFVSRGSFADHCGHDSQARIVPKGLCLPAV